MKYTKINILKFLIIFFIYEIKFVCLSRGIKIKVEEINDYLDNDYKKIDNEENYYSNTYNDYNKIDDDENYHFLKENSNQQHLDENGDFNTPPNHFSIPINNYKYNDNYLISFFEKLNEFNNGNYGDQKIFDNSIINDYKIENPYIELSVKKSRNLRKKNN